ncbi:hypothetical protein ACWEGV_38170, partial [Streptomyces sp. NPDC004976]
MGQSVRHGVHPAAVPAPEPGSTQPGDPALSTRRPPHDTLVTRERGRDPADAAGGGQHMRDGQRADAERLLARAVEEEVRRSGGRTDGKVLLTRARGALDTMAQTAAEEYEAYTRALDEAEAGRLTFGQRYAREGAGTPLLVAGVAAGGSGWTTSPRC